MTIRGSVVGAASIAGLLLAPSAAAATPGWSDEAAPGLPIWRVIAATALCVGLAILLAILLRRRLSAALSGRAVSPLGSVLPGRRSRRVRIVERASASPGLTISVVEYDEVEYVLASSQSALLLLDRRAAAVPPAGSVQT